MASFSLCAHDVLFSRIKALLGALIYIYISYDQHHRPPKEKSISQ
jgi:hypothetical protein